MHSAVVLLLDQVGLLCETPHPGRFGHLAFRCQTALVHIDLSQCPKVWDNGTNGLSYKSSDCTTCNSKPGQG